LTLAVHLPLRAEELASHVHRRAASLDAGAAAPLQPGKLRARGASRRARQGHGDRRVHGRAALRRARPVFIGDDVTDEYGFAGECLGGCSVKVGAGRTRRARFRLPIPRRARLAGWRLAGARPAAAKETA
jgi:trehalose 6-phosphate phosphatase